MTALGRASVADCARVLAWIAICAAASPTAANADAYVVQTSQVCFGNAAGECETAPSVIGAGLQASLSRSEDSTGFHYLRSTNISANHGAFAGFARASGTESPENVSTFQYSITRVARSFGTFADVVTAGEGGGSGFFRMSIHLSGGSAVSWQNGLGATQLGISCVSSDPGSPFAIGHCTPVSLIHDVDTSVDTVVDLDIPIVLGSPFQYSVQVFVEATTGHPYGSLNPFTGAAEATYVGSFVAASVLDAGGQVIPGAPISAGESGFAYVPEPAGAALGLAALAALGGYRRVRPR